MKSRIAFKQACVGLQEWVLTVYYHCVQSMSISPKACLLYGTLLVRSQPGP